MQKSVNVQFSKRLKNKLVQMGYHSSVSILGVKVRDLANAVGCSNQMARRYVNGEAMPDYDSVFKISEFINESPCWLLFGQTEENSSRKQKINDSLLEIEKNVFEHLLAGVLNLNTSNVSNSDLVSFVTDLISDLSIAKANEETKINMINISLKSINNFITSNKEVAVGNKNDKKQQG